MIENKNWFVGIITFLLNNGSIWTYKNCFQIYYNLIITLFYKASKLEYLNLSHNRFGEVAGLLLGPAIAENTTMKELDISWNNIRRKGAMALGQGIKVNKWGF